MHVLQWSCRPVTHLDHNKWAEAWGLSPGPAEDADARTLKTETPITIWTVTSHPVWRTGASPCGNKPPVLFIFIKCAVCECACKKCTSGVMLLGYSENVHCSSPQPHNTQNRVTWFHLHWSSPLLVPKASVASILLLNVLVCTSALVPMHTLLFYWKRYAFNKDLPSCRCYVVIRQAPDRENWIKYFHE